MGILGNSITEYETARNAPHRPASRLWQMRHGGPDDLLRCSGAGTLKKKQALAAQSVRTGARASSASASPPAALAQACLESFGSIREPALAVHRAHGCIAEREASAHALSPHAALRHLHDAGGCRTIGYHRIRMSMQQATQPRKIPRLQPIASKKNRGGRCEAQW